MISKDSRKLYLFSFVFLALFWAVFLYSERSLQSLDWYAIDAWLSSWKEGLRHHVVPYYVNMFEGNNLWGTRFFAMPYIIASPQVLLLAFLSVKQVIYIHVLVSTAIGLWGLIKFREHFDLDNKAFFTLILFFFLGGFCVDRVSVGHIQNAFYLAIPAFLWMIYRYFTSSPGLRSALSFSLFLFLGLLQGSLHVIHQFIFVLLIFSLFRPRYLPYSLLIVLLFAVLSAYFIIPNLFYGTYNDDLRTVFGGYGYGSGDSVPLRPGGAFFRITHLDFAVAVLSHFAFAFFRVYGPSFDATWEYSLYASPLILYYLWLCREKLNPRIIKKRLPVVLPVCLIALLSIGYGMPVLFMAIEKIFHNKFPVVDRLPSRIFFYPFSIAVVYAVITHKHAVKKWHVWLSLAYLLVNAWFWRVDNTLQLPVPAGIVPHVEVLDTTQGTGSYENAVRFSYLFSLVAVLAACAYLYFTKGKKQPVIG